MIKKAGNSAADLVRQLLAFSRQQMLQPRVLDLKQILEQSQATLQRLMGEDVKLEVSLAGSLGHIEADPGQIEQVLLNLAVNARDAMPKGGRLTITASNVELDESDKKRHEPIVPGNYVRLTVEDTGCGMDAKTQLRIFDPFFTTKEVGKGTGLGLATVYGIVKQTGGYIWVYSEVDQGTAFKIYLPRIEGTLRPVEQQKTAELPVVKGCETILFAEDSESLREMATEYLQSVGYRVIPAASGKDALLRAKDFNGTIHLLLTDVVMPELNGPELAKEMVSIRPRIKVIFTSGYASEALANRGSLDPAVAFIQKPYRPKALARRIREILDAPVNDTVKA
jgi:CheY-like chemotaxis protein